MRGRGDDGLMAGETRYAYIEEAPHGETEEESD
jgi:hypothetical protein